MRESSWRNDPAAALRGLANSFSPLARCASFNLAKSRLNISTSPRTSTSLIGLRQLDSRITASRRLSFFSYGIGFCDGAKLPDQQDQQMALLQQWGVPVAQQRSVVRGLEGLLAYYLEIGEAREQLPFDIDGVVYKVNDIAQQ